MSGDREPCDRPSPGQVLKYTGVLRRVFGTRWVTPETLICRQRTPERHGRTRAEGGRQR